jgi:elongation factor Ts
VVTSYVHSNNRIGVLLEVNCETDFVAQNADFKQFCADVAMQIAAMNPSGVRREDLDTAKIEGERALLREKALAEGKPEKMVDRIVDGQIGKYYSEHVPARAEVREGRQEDDRAGPDRGRGEARREHPHPPVRALRAGRGPGEEVEDFAAEVAAQVAAVKV